MPFIGSVTLGTLFNLSVVPFFHLWNGDPIGLTKFLVVKLLEHAWQRRLCYRRDQKDEVLFL